MHRLQLALALAALMAAPLSRAEAQLIRFSRGVSLTLSFDDRPGFRPFVLADVNGDSRVDLIAAARDSQDNAALAVALNDGTGGFSDFQFFADPNAVLSLPAVLAVGDFGSPTGPQPDGTPDVALASGNHLVIADGTGNGQFIFSDGVYALGTGQLVDLVSGNFDRQNGADLALVDDAGFLLTLCSVAEGGFGQCSNGPTSTDGVKPGPIARGDVNGDGLLDLVVLNRGAEGGRGSLAVFLGDGDGSFTLMSPLFDVGKPNATDVAVGRLDEDAIDDVAVTFLEPFGGDSLQVFLGRSTGRLRPGSVREGLSFVPAALAIADFDADGVNDLVAPQLQDDLVTAVMRGTGAAQFDLVGSSLGLVTGPALAVEVADLDGDQLPDLMVLRTDHQQLRAAINISDEILTPTPTPSATASITATASVTPTATVTSPPPTPTATATLTATATQTSSHRLVDDDGCTIAPQARGGSALLLPVMLLLLARKRT